MLKRKRSWEVAAITSHGQSADTARTQSTQDVFARPAPRRADTLPPAGLQDINVGGSLMMDGSSIDHLLHASTVNGTSIGTSWKPQAGLMTASSTDTEALPAITRKITACAACRKQKIKCEMPNENPPCTRCSRKGLLCVLNKSLQTLLEDTKQTELLQCDVYNIHETIDALCRKLGLAAPRPLAIGSRKKLAQDNTAVSSDNDQECEVSPPNSPSAVQAPIDTFIEVAKLGSPTSTDTPRSRRQSRLGQHQDLIAKGLIPGPIAEILAQRYFSRLDHYLYGIGSGIEGAQSLRNLQLTSPILVAAICTVSALHDAQDQSIYELCNKEFRRLVAKSTFEKRGVDHLQALCIGSFWLTDASRILLSDAVRRAADARLHKHFQQLLEPEEPRQNSNVTLSPAEHTNRVRLWYLLFICDQHLSILHNRDPLLKTDKEITANCETFLEREDATDSDVRLISQVSLLLIMGQVRDTFGSELDQKLAKVLAVQITSFSKQLDKWFAKFSKLFKPHAQIGEFPMKGLQMHYQFGKLYLAHHVFKGLKGDPIPIYFLSSASIARDAAIEIFDMILRDQELQQNLVGMPHYFHIMIAFAGHFLLEVCNKYHEQLSIDLKHSFDLIGKVLSLFTSLTCIPQHPISRMTGGLLRKLVDTTATANGNMNIHSRPNDLQDFGELHPSGINVLLTPSMSSQFTTQDDIGSHFDPQSMQTSTALNDLMFADFEQFSFPDMTINFTS